MNTTDILERLAAAVRLESDDAAIRIESEYVPQGGPTAKVHPPTYIADRDGSRYHRESRWRDGQQVDVVVLDSIQSQANRAEQALHERADELGLPQLVVEAQVEGRPVRVSSLQAPHRSRDAYFLDSELDGLKFDDTPVGVALGHASREDATAYLQYAPYDLVYGVWDSHRGKRLATKFPRVVTSEMLGWSLLEGRKAATKTDPLNLPGSDEVSLEEWRPALQTKNRKSKTEKLSELGHGMVPVAADTAVGGVSVQSITRQAVISFTGLALLRFPFGDGSVDTEGRVALAALALVADRLAFARAGLHLRSGSDLVRARERLEWVQAGDEADPLDLSVDMALELLAVSRERLAGVGVPWEREPIVLQASPRLQRVIEKTFTVAELDVAE